MAQYYEYGKHNFSFSDDDASSHDSSEELNRDTIPKEWNVKFGDIIALKNYRDTGTIFVGIDKKVVGNPDYSASGYLSIPLEITQLLFDAWWYYKKIFLNKEQPRVSIDLKPDDQWIIGKFGKEFPADWKIRLWYNWGKFESMYIDFNAYVNQSFGLDVTYDQLIELSKKAIELRYSFNVWYNIFGEANIKNFNDLKKKKINLPNSWVESCGSSGSGMNHEDSQYTYYGPQSDAYKAYHIVKNHYRKFKGRIDIQITEPIEGIRNICGSHKDKNGYSHPTFSKHINRWSIWE